MARVKAVVKELLPDPVVDLLVAVNRHKRRHGKYPSLLRPQTFNEKIVHRKIFDKRPLLTTFADKYAVREYVAERLGDDLLPRLYYSTFDPSDIPFDKLPGRFVVKPTHGSGWIRIVTNKSQLNKGELVTVCENWLTQNYYKVGREWPYKNVTPRILIEEFVGDEAGNIPHDFKLFVFGGRVECIQVDVSRFNDHKRNLYDRDWNKMDVTFLYPPAEGSIERPAHLNAMIECAETLCRGIDFVRADFYDTGRRLYFGELTTTPECGLGVFEPVSFDTVLGKLWRL